jgi:hypothetical protein
MMIQSDYQNVLRSREELEKKLIAQEGWDKERSRYCLEKVGLGVFVYALKAENQGGEPKHWICSKGYEDKQKSILQGHGMNLYLCPRCKTDIHVNKFL